MFSCVKLVSLKLLVLKYRVFTVSLWKAHSTLHWAVQVSLLSPETLLCLFTTKNCDLWAAPTLEVCNSWTFGQIWLCLPWPEVVILGAHQKECNLLGWECPGLRPGRDIVMCSWERYFTLTVSLVYKWVPDLKIC